MKNLLFLFFLALSVQGCGEKENSFSCQVVVQSRNYEFDIVVNGKKWPVLKAGSQKGHVAQQGLFHKNHPVKQKALADQKDIFCLEKEDLKLEINFKKLPFDKLHSKFENFNVRVVSPDMKTEYFKFIPETDSGTVTKIVKLPINEGFVKN